MKITFWITYIIALSILLAAWIVIGFVVFL